MIYGYRFDPNELHIIGDKIEYKGFHVADLVEKKVPATIQDEFLNGWSELTRRIYQLRAEIETELED